ncbi:MAG TPA: O-antigen ligase family protein, partial [Gaiellaceae bacterium]|nr:O-antigen ligase family protein [Gaiellaceae bacterium]
MTIAPVRPSAPPPAPPSTRRLSPAALAASLVVAAAVFLVAFDGGSYGLLDRNSIAIGLWWTIALTVGLGILPLERVPRAALLTAVLLAALAALTLLSALWADSVEATLNEFNRVVLYLGVFALVVLASKRLTAPRWSDGIALGITAVALVALASRFLPGLFPGSQLPIFLPTERTRLYYPLNYWNGLAILVALGAPLLLRAAVAPGSLVRRAVALAPFPALAAVIYLTSSRGGTAATVAGVVAFLALTAHRWAAAGAATLAALGSAGAVVVLLDRHELVNGPLDSAAAEAQGRSAAALVLLACVLTGALYALAVRYVPRGIRVGPRVAWALVAVVALLALAGVAAADPVQRFEEFKRPPEASLGDDPIRAHLTSASGNGRWQWWAAAVDQFRSHPLLGDGAGSYEAWWARHGTLPGFVRDAHSLYLEMLGELGLPGFLLVLAIVGSGFFVGMRRLRRHDPDGRTVTAAFLAGLLAYALAAGVDWMWELTAVSVVGVAFLALLTGAATGVPGRRPAARSRVRRRTIGTVPAV